MHLLGPAQLDCITRSEGKTMIHLTGWNTLIPLYIKHGNKDNLKNYSIIFISMSKLDNIATVPRTRDVVQVTHLTISGEDRSNNRV